MYHLCTTAIFRAIYHKRKTIDIQLNINGFRLVGVTRFELATTRPPDAYSNRAELHPVAFRSANIVYFSQTGTFLQDFFLILSSMKRFLPLIPLLLALLGTTCGGSASYTPADFTTEVYTPAYASGFDIRGTERNAATLVTVRTPWQGGSGVEQHARSARGHRTSRRFRRPDRESPRTPCGLHVVEPRSHVRRHRSDTPRLRRLRNRLHFQRLCQRTPLLRRSPRRGLRHEPQLRTARRHATRPDAAVRRHGRKHRRHGQTPRTGHTLYICRRLHGRIAAGQSRMADGRRRTLQRPRPGRRNLRRHRRALRSHQNRRRRFRTRRPPQSDAQHPLPRHLVHAFVAQFHDPPDRGRRG